MFDIYTPQGHKTADSSNKARAILARAIADRVTGQESEVEAAKVRALLPGRRLYGGPGCKTTVHKVDDNTYEVQSQGRPVFTYFLEEAQEEETAAVDRPLVSLFVSGYGWVCPDCECLNYEIEIKEVTYCAGCFGEYDVDPDTAHAYG